MTPASEVTPAQPVSRNLREIEGRGCETKELSPRLVIGSFPQPRSAFVVSINF